MFGSRTHPLSRREALELAAASVATASLSGWMNVLAARAADQTTQGVKHKSCILLWMDGGPSHLDTFDLKPDAPAEVRGEFKPIATKAEGVEICEMFPQLAQVMGHAAILRGMSTHEGDHEAGRIYVHTGYRPNAAGLTYPGLGSIVSAELGQPDFPLPNFVVTGVRRYPATRFVTSPGFLGPAHRPLIVGDLSRGVQNLQPTVEEEDFKDRLSVLDQLEQAFKKSHGVEAIDGHGTAYQQAVQLMHSDRSRAFDLQREPAASRAAYGDSDFGQGCLLARRLVEVGVPFVEVYLPDWDAHDKVAVGKVKRLMPQLDQGLSTLVRDLADRGLLDSTLLIWMGEFGRTSRINKDGGRDHQNRAWSSVLIGGGIKGGQVIGKTDRLGATVADRPVSEVDFLATVCKVLGIDYAKRNTTPGGRPIRIVDKGEKVIEELFA
jgi:hypothetical protein